jgi:hypothetical protein
VFIIISSLFIYLFVVIVDVFFVVSFYDISNLLRLSCC